MDSVLEYGVPWKFEYDTGIMISTETVICRIFKRVKPEETVAVPKVAINNKGKVTMELSAKETKKFRVDVEESKWDCYLYEVYMIANRKKNRIMYGTIYVIPTR